MNVVFGMDNVTKRENVFALLVGMENFVPYLGVPMSAMETGIVF